MRKFSAFMRFWERLCVLFTVYALLDDFMREYRYLCVYRHSVLNEMTLFTYIFFTADSANFLKPKVMKHFPGAGICFVCFRVEDGDA